MSDKTNEKDAASKAPSHIAYQVRDREGKKSFWTRIGSRLAARRRERLQRPGRSRATRRKDNAPRRLRAQRVINRAGPAGARL